MLDHQISSINTNLNEYGGYQAVGAGDSPSITGAGGAAVNGSATLINGGPGVHNVPNGTATGPGLQNNLGTQASQLMLISEVYYNQSSSSYQ